MSKKLLDRELEYIDFVESCSNNAFSDNSSDVLYYEKSLFMRICAGQMLLKNLFRKGHKVRLLNVSHCGPQRFFLELIVIHYNIPLFLARLLFKIKFVLQLFRLSFQYQRNGVSTVLSNYENLTFLFSDYDRLTDRFTKVIRDAENICEIHSDCGIRLISSGNDSIFFLPKLTIPQYLSVLFAPSWKITYLTRTYRQYNFIKKYNIKNVYIMDGDSPGSVSSAYAATLADTCSYCVQWGAMPIGIKPGYKLFPFNYYLSTGQYYADLLKPFSDRTEFIVRPYKHKKNIDKNNNDNNNFNRCNSILFLLDECDTAISKKESDFLINLCVETKRLYPFLNVVARPHPDMILDDCFVSLFKECGIVLDKVSNPNIALIQNKFVVGHISSLMIESVEYDCFPIFMEIGIKNLYPDLIKLSAAMKFRTKKEWFLILENLLKNYCAYKSEKSLKKSLNNRD